MTPGDRRHRRTAAVVGLLCGLALLLGAVLDGGPAAPNRADEHDPVHVSSVGDSPVPHLSVTRDDVPAWGQTIPTSRIAVLALVGLVALGAAAIGPSPLVADPRRRVPALLAARHRGPPTVV